MCVVIPVPSFKMLTFDQLGPGQLPLAGGQSVTSQLVYCVCSLIDKRGKISFDNSLMNGYGNGSSSDADY